MKLLVGLCLGVFALTACSEQTVQAAPIAAQTETWQANWDVVAAESSVKFTAIYTGESFEGSFTSFNAKIKFDPKNLGQSKLLATIDLSSVEAGEIERTEALPGKEWFYAKNFPKAIFNSREFIHQGGDKYQVTGNFTLRGTTKELVLPFTLRIEDDGKAHMQGGFSLNRRDYNVGTGMWKSPSDVAHNVDVKVVITATKMQ